MLETLFNQRYIARFGVSEMLFWEISLCCGSALLLLLIAFSANLLPWGYQTCKIPASFGIALILGNAPSLTLEAANNNAGASSAFIGAFQMIAGALVIFLVNYLANASLIPLGITISCCSFAALWIYGSLNQRAIPYN